MSFIDQLDRAIRALRRKRKPDRMARVNALAAHLRAASSEGERDLVRAELAGLRRGGKARSGLPSVRFVSLKLTEPPRLKLSVDGHVYTYAGDGAVMVYVKGLLTRRSKRARVDGLNHARANLTLVGGARRGGKRRFDPAQLKAGTAAELEHAKTIKKIVARKLPVKQAAAEIAKDHLKERPDYYDRLDAVEVPKRRKGMKKPRLKLLMKRGKVRVYLVDSHLVRQMKGQGDWANGGHSRVFPETCPPNEVWVGNETFGPERKCYILHELLEFWRMGNGMGYDQAHDLSTAAEQKYRSAKMRGIDAAIRAALKKAAGG